MSDAVNESSHMQGLFAWLRIACEKEDTATIDRLRSSFRRGGIQVAFKESSNVEYNVDTEGFPEASLKRTMELCFGNCTVYKWQEEYFGYYGSMGAGWWQELGDTDLEDDVREVLAELGLEYPDAHVPPPPENGDDDESDT